MPTLSELEDRGYRALMARERRYASAIGRTLRESLDKIRVDMARIYEKYAVDGKLSLADMTRYNRLTTLERSVTESMSKAARKTLATIDRLRPEQYEAAFFRTAWAVDQASGVATAWGVVNRDVVLENIANPFYREAHKLYTQETLSGIRRALNSGLAQGKSYTAMMKDIKTSIDNDAYRAMRIVRTEGQTAVNAGTDAAYMRAEEKGIEFDRYWDATLDGRTRPDHQAADGQKKHEPIEGFESGYFTVGGEKTPFPVWQGLTAAQRIHCRCRERAQIVGYEPQLRRSREQGVIPYQTYEEWEKNYNTTGGSVPKPTTPATTPKPEPKKTYAFDNFEKEMTEKYGDRLYSKMDENEYERYEKLEREKYEAIKTAQIEELVPPSEINLRELEKPQTREFYATHRVARQYDSVGLDYGATVDDDIWLHGSNIRGDIDDFGAVSETGTVYLTKSWDVAEYYGGGGMDPNIKVLRIRSDARILDMSLRKDAARLAELYAENDGIILDAAAKKRWINDLQSLDFIETGPGDNKDMYKSIVDANIDAIIDASERRTINVYNLDILTTVF